MTSLPPPSLLLTTAARGRGTAAYVSDFISKIFGMQILTLFYPRYQIWTWRMLGAKFISALGPQILF